MNRLTIESTPYEGLKESTHIDVEVYYSKDNPARRGYYVKVTPVTHKNGIVSYTLFSGIRKLLMPTNRFSQKQFDAAVEMAKLAAPELKEQVLAKERAA